MTVGFAGDSAWKPVKIGAGGWVTGIDVAPDGTMVARTDTYGAYLWTGSSWKQLVTASSMPEGSFYSAGVYEIRVAASNSNIFYMENLDGVFRSVDRGQTWVKTSFAFGSDANTDRRMDGQKLAIDPTNPNIVYVGTQGNGLWMTKDGGTNWQKVLAVPQGGMSGDAALTGITIQGSKIFVGTAGGGVYLSSDGGATWGAIGGPSAISEAAIDVRGIYYASDNADGALWKYASGAWTKLIAAEVQGIAIDPFNPNHLIATRDSGHIQESNDGGVTWSGWNWAMRLESSNDIGWLENSGLYMSAGGLVFDPLVPGKLWQSAGVGVWSMDLPSSLAWNTPITWNSQSQGIEQLVANDIIAPAGSDPLFAAWDRPFFSQTNPDQYATSYSGGEFSMGWSVDYASSDSRFMVGISDWWGKEESGFSTDGGKTWQKFAGLPTWAWSSIGGSIAASTPQNFIWVASGNNAPAYTLDGGKTWTNISIAGITDWRAVHPSYYLERTTIAADRVQPNTFYLFDSGTGLYRTVDGGVSWQKMYSGQIAPWSYWNAKIEAVPNSAGELYFTSGPQGSDQSQSPGMLPLMHSRDGGATWEQVAGVQTTTFGFGAAATAGGPATVYIVGSVNGVFGIWYSADGAQSWTQVGERPMGSLDSIKTISGDMDQFGLVYVGFNGSGFAYLDFANGTPTPPAPTSPTPPSVTIPTPTQTALIASALDDAGGSMVVGSGALTNDATPTLSGTLSAVLQTGQSLSVYRDGQLLSKISPAATQWSFTDPGAPDGLHQYTVRVETNGGQSGAFSTAFGLTIDSTAPGQAVSVTGVATVLATSSTYSTTSLKGGSVSPGLTMPSAIVTGVISGSLASDEVVVVYRDGVRVGTATASNGAWQFTDDVTSGTYNYTAQVEDAAGNLGHASAVFSAVLGANNFFGTTGSDFIIGTSLSNRISGVPETGRTLGKGTVDVLTGGGGDDVFVLGDARGRFYDDANRKLSGTADYARITDFSAGDKLQLKGVATDYVQKWTTLGNFSGTGIYHDTNGNGVWDTKDELIALVQNYGRLDPSSFLYV